MLRDYFALCSWCKDALAREEAEYCHACGGHSCAEHTTDAEGGANKCWSCTGKGDLYEGIRRMARGESLTELSELVGEVA